MALADFTMDQVEDIIMYALHTAYQLSPEVAQEFMDRMGEFLDAMYDGDKQEFREIARSIVPGVGPQAYAADIAWDLTEADVTIH